MNGGLQCLCVRRPVSSAKKIARIQEKIKSIDPEAVEKGSKTVAEEIGYAPSSVRLAVNGKYTAKTAKLAAKEDGRETVLLMNESFYKDFIPVLYLIWRRRQVVRLLLHPWFARTDWDEYQKCDCTGGTD